MKGVSWNLEHEEDSKNHGMKRMTWNLEHEDHQENETDLQIGAKRSSISIQELSRNPKIF